MQNQTTNQSNGEQAILEAAAELFAEQGFAATSMSAIARLANTSKANIYHHFSSKNDLYLAIMKAAASRSSALLAALADAGGSFSQRLAEFSAGQLSNILTHQRSTQLIMREALSGGSERGREIAEIVVNESFAQLVSMIRQGQQVNEFRNDIDPALTAFIILAANHFFFQAAPVMQHVPEINFGQDADNYTHDVMDIVFNGVLAAGENCS